MKILMFGWEFPPAISGGLGVACHGLSKGIMQVASDADITFVLPELRGDEDQSHVRVVGARELAAHPPAPPAPRASAYASGHVDRAQAYGRAAAACGFRACDFDLIHAHDWLSFPAAMAVQLATGRPFVAHVHSTEYDRTRGNGNPRIRAIEQQGLERADRVVTVSEYSRRVLIDEYGVPSDKVLTVYNAAEASSPPAPVPRPAGSLRQVAFVGRLTYQKGPEYFLAAAARLLDRRDDVQFVMAGDGDMHRFLEQRTYVLGLRDRIRFPGFLAPEGVRALLAGSDVLVMPSVSEPFGILAVEAALCGVPLVLSRHAGAAEVLPSAVQIDPRDIGALAAAVARVLDDPVYASRVAADTMIEAQRLSWAASARKLLEVFDSVTASHVVQEA